MVWTFPNTVAVGEIWASDDFNLYVRDNLLETAPGLITETGNESYWFTTDGSNSLFKAGNTTDFVNPAETTTSGIWADLATPGPEITLSTHKSAMICFGAHVRVSVGGTYLAMSVEISGATTRAPSSEYWLYSMDQGVDEYKTNWVFHIFTDLNPGDNTFTCKYQSDDGDFDNRRLFGWVV